MYLTGVSQPLREGVRSQPLAPPQLYVYVHSTYIESVYHTVGEIFLTHSHAITIKV